MKNRGSSKGENTLKYRKGHQKSRFARFGTRATLVSKNDEKTQEKPMEIDDFSLKTSAGNGSGKKYEK